MDVICFSHLSNKKRNILKHKEFIRWNNHCSLYLLNGGWVQKWNYRNVYNSRCIKKNILWHNCCFKKWDFTLITWNTPKQFVITNFCCSVFFLGDQNCKSYNFSHELNQKWKQQITKKFTFVWLSRTINFVRKYRFLSCAFFIFPLRETATLEWFKRDVLEVMR